MIIISYRKQVTRETTKTIELCDGDTELCTIDGVSYASVQDASAVVDPHNIGFNVEAVSEELRENLCAQSPHVQLIQQRVRDKISELYSVYDEIKLLRTAPSPEFDVYNEHAELCRQWGREQKALLGL